MKGTECSTTLTVTIEAGPHGEMAELVRGREGSLIERIKPLVRRRSVTLDMHNVERIDAAGISALITLYCAARQAGHDFMVSRAVPRVEEILALVGVKRLLNPPEHDEPPEYNFSLQLAEV